MQPIHRAVIGMVVAGSLLPGFLRAAAPEDDVDPYGPPRRTSTKELKAYLWYDAEGWHIKSPGTPAGSGTHRLHGSAKVIGGKVTKVGNENSMDPG